MAYECNFNYPHFWGVIEESLCENSQVESVKDITDIMFTLKDSRENFSDDFYERMLEKVISNKN